MTPVTSKKTIIALISIIALTLISLLISLGSWQMHRLTWKHELIERIESNVHAEPISAPNIKDWEIANQKAMEYRAVTVTGYYLNDKETHVGALTEKGSGYWIITPLKSNNGDIVFINRGYVGIGERDPQKRITGQIDGEVNVTGLLRLTEPKGFFLRQNEPDKNIWHARDIKAFSNRLGLQNVPEYFIDANAEQNRADRPIGGMTVIKFADNHLAYALTWFSLAAMVLGMAIYLIRYEIIRNKDSE